MSNESNDKQNAEQMTPEEFEAFKEECREADRIASGLFGAQMRIIDLEEAGASAEDIEKEFGGWIPDEGD